MPPKTATSSSRLRGKRVGNCIDHVGRLAAPRRVPVDASPVLDDVGRPPTDRSSTRHARQTTGTKPFRISDQSHGNGEERHGVHFFSSAPSTHR